jgi:hypothetical protein
VRKINKKYFSSWKNFFVLLTVSLSLVVGISCFLFIQSAFSASSPNINLFNSSSTIHIVHKTIIGPSGTVNISSLPPASASSHNNFNKPFLTVNPEGYEKFKNQLESGSYPLDRIPHVQSTPIKNKANSALSRNAFSPHVTINIGFNGTNETNTYAQGFPPDVQIAAGTNYLMEMVNTEGAIYTKQGALAQPGINLASFFSFRSSDNITDPKVLFDPLSGTNGRWFASISDVSNFTAKIAVSDSNDPTGTWHVFHLQYTSGCPDQPKIATSNDKFVISSNLYINKTTLQPSCNPGSEFIDSDYIVIDKNQMVNNQNPLTTKEYDDSSVVNIVPAKSLSSTSDLFMITNDPNYPPKNGSAVTIYKVSGPIGNLVISSNLTSTAALQLNPPNATQPGSSVKILTDDHRVQDAAWFKGKLWASWNDSCVPSGDNMPRSCVHLFSYDTHSGLGNEVHIGSYQAYFFYPALSMDSAGGMSVIFGDSSNFTYPSLFVTGQAPYDQPNSVEPLTDLVDGSIYNTSCRYGDYFGAAVDPSSPLNIWIAGEYMINSTTVVHPTSCPNDNPPSSPVWSTFIAEDPIWCQPPLTSPSDWNISSSCTMGGSFNATRDVYIANNSVMTIPNGITVGVNFASHKVFVNPGSGILIKPGGKLVQD